MFRGVNSFHLFRRLVALFLLEVNDGQEIFDKSKVVKDILEGSKRSNFFSFIY